MSKEEKTETKGFIPKMKECPWCGNTNFPTFPDMDTNYFLLGLKGNKSELTNINTDILNKLTDYPVIPFSCSKCGYTILLNKAWVKFNQ